VYPLHRDEGVSPVNREQLRDDALPPAIGLHADIEDAAIAVESQHLETDFVEGPLACPCREEMLELGPELLSSKDRGELRAVPRDGVLLNQEMFTKYYRALLKKCTCSVLCASGVHRLRKIAKALAPQFCRR